MKQILLISSNQNFIEDLSSQIKHHIEDFEVVTSSDKPDLVIVDEDIEHLKDFPKVPNILLTSKAESSSSPLRGETSFAQPLAGSKTGEGEKLRTFLNIQKPFSLNTFFKDLKSIIQRFENTTDGYLYFNQYELRPGNKEIVNLRNNELIKLTEREVSILKYLYKHQNEITNKNDLLEDVWGYNIESTTHTVETHIYRLRQKIEHEDTSSQIIETLDGGYKLIV